MSNLYGIDWILTILNLYAYYLISCSKSSGFLLGLIGSILGIVLFAIIFSIPMIIMYASFAVLNWKGYLNWTKKLN